LPYSSLTALTGGSHRYPPRAGIEQHVALRRQLGVCGTPIFFVAVSGSGDEDLRLVRRITGAQPLGLFEQELRNRSTE